MNTCDKLKTVSTCISIVTVGIITCYSCLCLCLSPSISCRFISDSENIYNYDVTLNYPTVKPGGNEWCDTQFNMFLWVSDTIYSVCRIYFITLLEFSVEIWCSTADCLKLAFGWLTHFRVHWALNQVITGFADSLMTVQW